MVADASTVKPTNGIVLDSKNLTVWTKKVETAAEVYPGRLVIRGTNDDDIVVCTGSVPVGWAGYEHTAKKYRPATVDTIYTVDSFIGVISGPGIKLVGSLALGVTAVPGTILKAAPDGRLTPGTAGSDDIVAVGLESVTTVATVADCLVESRI